MRRQFYSKSEKTRAKRQDRAERGIDFRFLLVQKEVGYGAKPHMFSLSRLDAGNFACGETARTNGYGAKPHLDPRIAHFFFPLHRLFFEKSEAIFQTIHHFFYKLIRAALSDSPVLFIYK